MQVYPNPQPYTSEVLLMDDNGLLEPSFADAIAAIEKAAAEVEVASESEQLEPPPWLRREVSADRRYLNSSLVNNPYKNWRNPRD